MRAAWRRDPGSGLRAASALFGAATHLRNFAYDVGLIEPREPPLPVVSVGGLTVGGSGKTPLTAELAGSAALRGLEPAILTHGFADELEVHAHLVPNAVVMGHPERHRAAGEAHRAGATIAYLDDGFQHRRLARDVDVVAADVDDLRRCNRLHLPAGPYRELWSAVGRADAVVFVRRMRTGRPDELLEFSRRCLPGHVLTSCRLRPGGVEPFSEGARRVLEKGDEPDPATAVASVMKPEIFLDQVATLGFRPSESYLLPDHGRLPDTLLAALDEGGGGGGVIGTLKDVVKLRSALAPATPLWCLKDELVWDVSPQPLLRLVTDGAVSRGRRRLAGGEGSEGSGPFRADRRRRWREASGE
ncbi:MAG: tetraacyldisaccharide 4'-kinase [Gemmatimonadota bacterium]